MNNAPRTPTPFTERTACPLCGSNESRPSRPRAAQIRRCRQCSLAYRVRPIHPLHTAVRTASMLQAIDASRRGLFRDVLEVLGPPRRGDLLVDIGASSGYFVEFAQRSGWRAIGIELGYSLAAVARDHERRVLVGDAQAVPLRTGVASAVTLWDVLDQFDRPRDAILEAARLLRPGGVLWLRVRNGPVHQFMRTQRWLPTQLSVLHNNLYSPACLRAALTEAGFDRTRVVASPTSRGDPYGAAQNGLGAPVWRLTKAAWNGAALALALLSAGRLLIAPSISVFASRSATPVARDE